MTHHTISPSVHSMPGLQAELPLELTGQSPQVAPRITGMDSSNEPPVTGLILSGGGAQAAYQVGVLQALAAMQKKWAPDQPRLFQVICGTSAGAINASALACGADDPSAALERLAHVWSHFHAQQVYRTNHLDMIRSGARWLTLLSLGWAFRARGFRPRSLLDNSPLAHLLQQNIPMERLPHMLAEGHLRALAITASCYSTGEHVTFYQSQQHIRPWVRHQRSSMLCKLDHGHLMASSGIPFVFPAVHLPGPRGPGWYGDGAMRQTAPISPAIHLGATRIMVIGVGRQNEGAAYQPSHDVEAYPSMARIAGHALSSIFLDALSVDVEALERVNSTLALVPPESRQDLKLRPLQLLQITPSARLDEIALRHLNALPATVLHLLRMLGQSSDEMGPSRYFPWGRASQGKSAEPSSFSANGAFMSYLLFEAAYTRELMALGRQDANAKAAEIAEFFGWPVPALPPMQMV